MSSEWPDAQLSSIQKSKARRRRTIVDSRPRSILALQNSWQIPYISLYARIFCDAFQLFDFHQEVRCRREQELHPCLFLHFFAFG